MTRHWWSHDSGIVTIPECIRAIQSLIDVINILCVVEKSSRSLADDTIKSLQGHIAIVEVSHLSKSAELSVPFHACIVFMRALNQLRIFASTASFHKQRQDKENHVVTKFSRDSDFKDVLEAIKKFANNLSFVCDMLKKGRNYFFHGTDSHQTFLLLICAFAVAPLLKMLYTSKNPAKLTAYVSDGICEPADTCHAHAMHLMIHMGIADGKVLLSKILTSQSEK